VNPLSRQTVNDEATGQQAQRQACLVQYGVPALFFIFFFVFLLVYIDPAVVYSSNGLDIHNYVAATHVREASPQHAPSYAGQPFRRLFILELTPAYVREIAGAPGGGTRLVVTLCIYACHYPVAGALTVTCMALFFYWIFSLYIQGTGGMRPFILSFLPPLFLLTICAWYELSYCAFLLPVAGALACTVLYQRLRPAAAVARALWLSLLFWSAWYLLQWGCLLVLLFAVIHELFSRERRFASVIMTAAVNGALLYAAEAWFIPLGMAIRWSDFTALSCLPLAMIGFFPFAAILLAAWGRLRRTHAGSKAAAIGSIVRLSLLLCSTAAAAVWLCREPVNRDTRTIARTVHHVMNGQWDAILHEKTAALFADFPQRVGPLQTFMVHAVDHALCRTGQLGDKLFTFPQSGLSADAPLMLESTHIPGYVNWVVVLDLAMDLGMVNTAEKTAGEIMENMGPYPDIIYCRALVQIAKGNNEAASVYLHKLACMPFHGADAKRLLGMLDNNGALLSDPRIAAMRANMDTADYFLFMISDATVLRNLLQSNPGNRAAYDYLMTYYLQTNRLGEAVALLSRASALGYEVLPRHWDEAVCAYLAVYPPQAWAEAHFFRPRRETVERYEDFVRASSSPAHDPAAAAKLAAAFGDTYYYFYASGHSRGAQHE
jgi:hypothetical protein